MMLLRDAVRRVGDEVTDIKREAKAEEHMTSGVVNGVDNGRFGNAKSNTFLMDLPPGGRVGLCFTHGTLRGLEASSMDGSRFCFLVSMNV